VPIMAAARVVLADDLPAFVAACTQLLQPEFAVVAGVHGGRDALTAVAEYEPDLLVLDISMPDLSGLEVLELLQHEGSATRTVVLTLHQEQSIADRALALGAYGYVTKVRMARDLPGALRAALAGEHFCSPLPPRT
jgi:two-component system nitrate/nitrite response regulator NarL